MAVGQVSSTNYDNWQLIATNTPTSGDTTSFTGLSGYKRYLITFNSPTFSGITGLRLTFNSSSTNYSAVAWGRTQSATSVSSIRGQTFIPLSNGNSGNTFLGQIFIDNLLAGPKIISGDMSEDSAGSAVIVSGNWNITDPITSIQIFASSAVTYASGSISLYGIAA